MTTRRTGRRGNNQGTIFSAGVWAMVRRDQRRLHNGCRRRDDVVDALKSSRSSAGDPETHEPQKGPDE